MATTSATTPSCVAVRMFSIFIASMTARRSPACTCWPTATATCTSRPGIGDSRNLLVSGGALCFIHVASAPARGDTIITSMRAPSLDIR